jgi:hypothetical protein
VEPAMAVRRCRAGGHGWARVSRWLGSNRLKPSSRSTEDPG